MAKIASKLATFLGRFVKVVMVVIVLPLAISLLKAILEQLDVASTSGSTFRQWIGFGFITYVGVHVLLYRPVSLFRASHRIFSAIAVWLFGGQVASVEGAAAARGKTKGARNQAAKTAQPSQGSTLVAFSPYVVPLYTVLICAALWLLSHWFERHFLDGPGAFLIGFSIALHWLMTADELQQQRSRWHIETYLLAISLVFALTLVIAGSCLPWAVPDFSFVRALGDGFSRTQAIYSTLIQRLFF